MEEVFISKVVNLQYHSMFILSNMLICKINAHLQYIHHELMSPALRDKTHLFNSFFYKALTQPAKKEPKKDPTAKKLNPSERMHQQVLNITIPFYSLVAGIGFLIGEEKERSEGLGISDTK